MTRTKKDSATPEKTVSGGVAKPRAQASVDAHEKRPVGRPPTYDREEVVAIICDRLSVGTPLTQVCAMPGMPDDRTVREWVAVDEGIASEIAQARARGYDAIADDCMRIADTPSPTTQSGSTDAGDVAHRKLRIETRLKLLAKWDPKRYGDTQHLVHSGTIGLESLIAGDDGEG